MWFFGRTCVTEGRLAVSSLPPLRFAFSDSMLVVWGSERSASCFCSGACDSLLLFPAMIDTHLSGSIGRIESSSVTCFWRWYLTTATEVTHIVPQADLLNCVLLPPLLKVRFTVPHHHAWILHCVPVLTIVLWVSITNQVFLWLSLSEPGAPYACWFLCYYPQCGHFWNAMSCYCKRVFQ